MSHTPEAALNRVLETLSGLHPKKIDLSLGRMTRLLEALGHPEKKLPPVFHVAGTNGKGSVIAYLRAILEAAGYKVHVYTSPHLVSFRERIRLAGNLVSEQRLMEILERVEKANGKNPITFFEITTAAAFVAFSGTPADVLLLEVGLGGRLDATNVISPLLSIITPVGKDHADFLGRDIKGIAREKAGIIKPGVPVICGRQSKPVQKVFEEICLERNAVLKMAGRDWRIKTATGKAAFYGFGQTVPLEKLSLPGPHQPENAGIAIAALLNQMKFKVSRGEILQGLQTAVWPARLQSLDPKSFKAGLPEGTKIWLDGGHNPMAGKALAKFLKEKQARPCYGIIGMMAGKDIRGFLKPLAPHLDRVIAVPIPGQENSADPETILKIAKSLGLKAKTALAVGGALKNLPKTPGQTILITGSLYLAGSVLLETGNLPE